MYCSAVMQARWRGSMVSEHDEVIFILICNSDPLCVWTPYKTSSRSDTADRCFFLHLDCLLPNEMYLRVLKVAVWRLCRCAGSPAGGLEFCSYKWKPVNVGLFWVSEATLPYLCWRCGPCVVVFFASSRGNVYIGCIFFPSTYTGLLMTRSSSVSD